MKPLDDEMAQLQTQENLLMYILAECAAGEVMSTLWEIRQVRRQMTVIRRRKVMNKVRLLVAVLVVFLLTGFVVSAQGDTSGGAIVIQPEGLFYSIFGGIVGLLSGVGVMYYRLKGSKPAQDLDENSRNGMLGLLLVGGWLASLTPGQWDDQQLDKLMQSNGFQKPVWDAPVGMSASGVNPAGGLPFKSVRREAPPIGDNMLYRDMTPLGDLPVHDFIDTDDDEVVKE